MQTQYINAQKLLFFTKGYTKVEGRKSFDKSLFKEVRNARDTVFISIELYTDQVIPENRKKHPVIKNLNYFINKNTTYYTLIFNDVYTERLLKLALDIIELHRRVIISADIQYLEVFNYKEALQRMMFELSKVENIELLEEWENEISSFLSRYPRIR